MAPAIRGTPPGVKVKVKVKMENENEIDELLKIAVEAGLEGLDFLSQFSYAQLADGYNGIGPEFLPPKLRNKVTDILAIFAPAALIHDMRNEMSDGTRASFLAANDEFRRNCIKLADFHFGPFRPRRYHARGIAQVLYDFVSAENFGWRAWLEAKERHAAKISSGNSVWGGSKNPVNPVNPV